MPVLKTDRVPTAQRIAREMKTEGLASLGLEKFKKIHMERLKQEVCYKVVIAFRYLFRTS